MNDTAGTGLAWPCGMRVDVADRRGETRTCRSREPGLDGMGQPSVNTLPVTHPRGPSRYKEKRAKRSRKIEGWLQGGLMVFESALKEG